MNTKLSNRVEKLQESETLKMAKLARQLIADGKDIINLSIGEPDFDTPDHIKEAAIKAINDNITHYPPVAGFSELRQVIAKKYNTDFMCDYDFNQVIVSSGAKQSLSNAILSLLDVGDEVIVPSPYWVSYPEMIKLSGADMVVIKAGIDTNYKITPQQLEEAITDKTRMFLFSSPSNPSGGVYCLGELEELAKVFRKYPNIIIVADEIYDHINYVGGPCSFAMIKDLRDRVVIVNGVSKGFAMTGWRIGYMVAPLWLATACNKLQGQLTSGPCTISQMAALEALSSSLSSTYKMRDEFKKRREIVVSMLSKISGVKTNVPDGAFYSLIDITSFFGKSYGNYTIEDSSDLAMFLLEDGNVSVVTGSAFGVPECVRISFATSEDNLRKAIGRIESSLKKLK
ncbi:MAG: pyridoxal phosphate-dependent aminotransferase [Bacteroidetes bacterium]|jgi:aspartate aminotransferase|nr:pyridoxal phosphate-dependent aminotransferase [Bacteroidota bacterium]MBT5529906.1 pyridoxal phosphate-dependent aminotransferase [Cytophagia bacterium]MBT3421662.1 pyridoxal phosphate-dependent aminotransferase [Bacteroidota bacterium]MBT3800803.1 pyridoxal phosphate-dependent aminotransferase [Bacteroidota bacterium]MBT3935048.1 pyridoxal phosphate-dependent aminotransferase [Bacteroidota bacterium]